MNDVATPDPSPPPPSPRVRGEGARRALTILAQIALIAAFVIVTLVMWLPAIVSKVPATTRP
jgi:hypothetical protein